MRISDWSSDVCSSDLRCAFRHGVHLEFSDQTLHLADFAHLAVDDAVGEQADLRVPDLCALASEDRHRMMRDHRLHVGDVVDGLLAAHQPKRHAKNHDRSEEHTTEPQSLMRNSYAVFCLKKKKPVNITNR